MTLNELQNINYHYFEQKSLSKTSNNISINPIINNSFNFETFQKDYEQDYFNMKYYNLNLDKNDDDCLMNKTEFKNIKDSSKKYDFETNTQNNLYSNIKYLQKKTMNKLFLSHHIQSIYKDFDRKHQIDNFSQKFLKAVNDWILPKINNKIEKIFGEKFNPPNYDIITHNANKKDLYFFINFKFKNILTFTLKDKQMLDELRKIKGDKQRKLPKIKLNDKEKQNLIKLLEVYNKKDSSKKNELNEKDINSLIQILIENKYKNSNDESLIFSDKINLDKLLIESKIIKKKKSYNLQEHNKILLKKIEQYLGIIPELEMKYCDLFNEYLLQSDSNSFKNNEDIIQINENFQKLKNKSKYSLLEIYKDKCGFIKMIEEDSGIKESQKIIYNKILEYFKDKEINENEIKKYLEIIRQKD